jgi:hypothetical protein
MKAVPPSCCWKVEPPNADAVFVVLEKITPVGTPVVFHVFVIFSTEVVFAAPRVPAAILN